MLKKIAIITLASLSLGGCTLQDMFKTNTAVTDSKTDVVATSTPVPTPPANEEPDEELDNMKPTSSSTDATSLETDTNNTTILQEDFSNIK